ncbi:AI-2E family transporter, partial [bacterium]|nr:AI-2E family transporter [bacterium]
MRRILSSLRYTNALLLTLAIAVISFHPWVMTAIREILSIVPLLLLVIVFVYVVNPIVLTVMHQIKRLPGRGWVSYNKSLLITYVMLLLLIVIVASLFIPGIVDELSDLGARFPALAKTVQVKLAQCRSVYDNLPPFVQDKVTQSVGAIGAWIGGLIDGSLAYAGLVSQALIWCIGAMIMVPLIAYYVLSDGAGMFENLLSFLPSAKRSLVRDAFACVHTTMQNFVRGQVLLCCAVGGVTMLAMAFVMPQYCLALGAVAGVTEAIPIIGPILGVTPAVII